MLIKVAARKDCENGDAVYVFFSGKQYGVF